jgi:hypothetical protein
MPTVSVVVGKPGLLCNRCSKTFIAPNKEPPPHKRAKNYLCEFPVLRTVLVGVCGPRGPGDVGGVRCGGEVRSKGAELNDATALHMRVFPTREVAALLISPSVTMSTRQTGHSSCLSSHSKMQSLWKMWVQYFDAIKTSPSSVALKRKEDNEMFACTGRFTNTPCPNIYIHMQSVKTYCIH